MHDILWKDIPGYEGRYQVSNDGQVRNAAGRILAPNKMNHGYLCVHLYNGRGKHARRVRTIHRLVAEAFIPSRGQAFQIINHKNFDRADNRVDNLEWTDQSGNMQHFITSGRRVKTVKRVRGISLATGEICQFDGLIEAERTLRGRQTGGISHAMKANRPAYGYVWYFA